MNDYLSKYIKYKNKYLIYKKIQFGGLAQIPTGRINNIVFIGNTNASANILNALFMNCINIRLVLTNIDKRRGKEKTESYNPVKTMAIKLGIKTISHDINDAINDSINVDAQIGVMIDYGSIIPVSILSKLPIINIHFSNLPLLRGPAPIQRAILLGHTDIGICITQVEKTVDTGLIFYSKKIAIHPNHTLTSLRNELVCVSIPLLIEALIKGFDNGKPQIGESTYAKKINNDDLMIVFTMKIHEILARIKLEKAWFMFNKQKIQIIDAQEIIILKNDNKCPGQISYSKKGVIIRCIDGNLLLNIVHPENKNEMSAISWLNGLRRPLSIL